MEIAESGIFPFSGDGLSQSRIAIGKVSESTLGQRSTFVSVLPDIRRACFNTSQESNDNSSRELYILSASVVSGA